MDRTGAVFMEFLEVQFRAVAFVLAKAVLRKLTAKFSHECVPCHLRNHARGRDAQAYAIPINDRGLWEWKGKDWEAVDQNMVRCHPETGDGNPHRLMGRAQEVGPVDVERIEDAHGLDNI